ncbi:MAG: hypothetical protein ACYSWQ_24190 [Planctomycetota bacterium]
MKSLTLYTCMIGMLLLTSVTFGEIIEYEDDVGRWDYYGWYYIDVTYCSVFAVVTAYTNSSPPPDSEPSSGIDFQGWMKYTVTEDNTYCDWSYSLYSYSYVSASRGDFDPHSASSSSYAYVGSPHCTDYAVTYAELDEGDLPETASVYDDDGPVEKDDAGSGWFDEGDSLFLDHQVYVTADITEGSYDFTYAEGEAEADGDLTEGELP